MIEQWFKQDIASCPSEGKRVVVCDAAGEGAFLLEQLPADTTVLTVANPIEEITGRYEAEKYHADSKVVFYVRMPIDQISFLFEYAQVDGLIDLSDLEHYIKAHLFEATGINATIEKSELIMAAKLGVGKDANWWKGVATGIIKPFNIQDCLLQFICAPGAYIASLDEAVRELFISELYKLMDKPKVKQTEEMMAKELMTVLFDGLVHNNLSTELLDFYYALTDKISFKSVMDDYLSAYTLSQGASALSAHIDHPFIELDNQLMHMLSEAIKNDTDTSACLHAISERIVSKNAQSYKAGWLKHLMMLFAYDSKEWNKTTSLDAFVETYKDGFACVDNAMRKIYVAWLHKPEVLRPIQYYYEQLAKPMFDKWYVLTKDYQPSQKNLVVEALQQQARVAVIVGDGLRLEIANELMEVAVKNKDVTLDAKTAFAMLPSVTENGMSALYGCEAVENSAQTRFAILKKQIQGTVVMALDAYNESVTADKLVLTFGDIDQVGEKKQLSGLKDISNYSSLLSAAVNQLLQSGYNKVYITADHGFVITGILDEADKVPTPNGTDLKVDERFVLSNEPIHNSKLIERVGQFGGYAYQYYAMTDKPFVSRGLYGYAHGGLSPQECIIPMYCFSKEITQDGCVIRIVNKPDLKAVTGSYFTAKISAEGNPEQLFNSQRKIKALLFDAQGKIQSTNIHTIKAGETTSLEYELTSSPCKLVITDFDTTEQLDSCEVGKSTARDIDDLF